MYILFICFVAAATKQIKMEWYYELNHLMTSTMSPVGLSPRYINAYKLFHHPRRHQIRKQPWVGYVMVTPDGKTRKLDGLTKPLKEVFYPYQRSESTGGAKTGGSARGNIVDKEIADLVNHCRVSTTLSKYTVQVLTYLKKHNLQPFAAQYLVFDENLGIATELDLLCIDLSVAVSLSGAAVDNVVNVQVKTGFDLNYETEKEYLSSPFVKDSAITRIYKNHKNTHQLQNLVEHMIVQLRYDRLLKESVVLVFSEEVNSLYRIGHMLMAVKADVYENLYKRQHVQPLDLQIKGMKAGAAAKKAKALFT